MERLTLRDDDGRALLTPYGLRIYCSSQATADCICKLEEALKVQEPRVLTLEELRALPEEPPAPLAMEERVPITTWDGGSVLKWCGSLFIQEEYLDDAGPYINADTYGWLWRVWTAWPSMEQKEAEPWQPRG